MQYMSKLLRAMALATVGLAALTARAEDKPVPQPPVITPGTTPADPPSDAIVLFEGGNLSKWMSDGRKDPTWTIENGVVTVKPGGGGMMTKEKFGDAQIHVEFATPNMPDKTGQDRGNSGVYMQGRYEVQVLDSYKSETYPDGQCSGLYGNHAPLVNACRPPEQWQAYEIIFRQPRFDAEGKKTSPATVTVLHNGVLVHDHETVKGETTAASFKEMPGDGPLYLQDHGCPVKYRNIWIRPLHDKP